ncbi:hypothetical protein [Kaistia sp. UC242_56]|uniref:hypothetical protein n=1 Tax=Kaistia sp. UC242_56 TaxID=3374625 RepID=UPI0037A08163
MAANEDNNGDADRGYVLSIAENAIAPENIKKRCCFACGGPPSTGQGEHVIPKWLQRKFSLHDERLGLLNQTLIPYRHLTVPCCTPCNTGFLSEIERKVQSIVDRGEIGSDDEQLAIARWMAKILIGILVLETALLLDRKNPSLGSIVPVDWIQELHHCHLILQSARKPTIFNCLHSPFPFSAYWYKIEYQENEFPFDLSTNIIGQSIAMRLGCLGIVLINDGGLQMEVGPKGPFDLLGSTVSETQFSELYARIHYKSSLRDATHFYINSESPTSIIINQETVRPYTSTLLPGGEIKIFRPWDETTFSYIASRATGADRSIFFDPATGKRGTFLGNLLGEDMVERSDAN